VLTTLTYLLVYMLTPWPSPRDLDLWPFNFASIRYVACRTVKFDDGMTIHHAVTVHFVPELYQAWPQPWPFTFCFKIFLPVALCVLGTSWYHVWQPYHAVFLHNLCLAYLMSQQYAALRTWTLTLWPQSRCTSWQGLL